jgi:nitrogen fixation protein FixH
MTAIRQSRWIPWTFVAGMGLVFAVNAGMVFAALHSFTGVTTGQSYDRGRAYNHVLAEAARQDALGWAAEVALEAGVLRVAVGDAAGRPVDGRLEGLLLRPIEGTTIPLTLAVAGPGRWEAAVVARRGQWDARLSLTDAEGHRLDIRRRMLVP